MAVRKGRRRQAKKLANAVRSHTRRLRHSEAAEPGSTPTSAAPDKAEPPYIPEDLVEGRQANELNMPPVMLVITVLAVLFIGLIAWFAARMPVK